jgi:hypothetical protein
MRSFQPNPDAPFQSTVSPDQNHPAYDLAFDDELWSKRMILEDAYSQAYTRRFGVPPSARDAFNMSYQIQALREMIFNKFGSFQDGLEGRLDRLQKDLEEFIDASAPLEEDDENFGNR